MNIQNKAIQIADLVKEFDILLTAGALDISSEATARSWIEKLLNIFDWNCLNPYEVDQEISLGKQEVENLNEINSTHRRPDYLLCAKSKSLVFIDAKKIGTNLEYDKKSAFQVRSYGWSAGHAYAIVTNFKEISIYDCRYKPLKDQNADVARVAHITYDKFIDRFNDIFNHLDKNKILTGLAFEKYKLTERPTGSLTLDEDFSEHIREWRLNFANDIFKNNKSIEFISESTQLLIDRIIFLPSCRGIEGDRHRFPAKY
jgi:hypothetical protein